MSKFIPVTKMDNSTIVDFSTLCQKSIDTVVEACKTCLVDYDRTTRGYKASTKKAWTHACVGLIRDDNSIQKDDIFLVPTPELTSQRMTLDFVNPENRVCSLNSIENPSSEMKEMYFQLISHN